MSLLRRNRSPVAPPPNRGRQSAKRTFQLWIALVFGMVAIYAWSSSPGPAAPPRSIEPERPFAWPVLLLPLGVAAVLALALRALRLPAGTVPPVLPDTPVKEPAPAAASPAQTPLKLLGKSDFAEASFTFEADGIRWDRSERIHSAAQTLFVPWAEVERLHFETASPSRNTAAVALLIGMAMASMHVDLALPAMAIAIVVATLLWRRGGRKTTTNVFLVTRTHQLQLAGGAALAGDKEATLERLYAHRPELRRPQTITLFAFYSRELKALYAPEAALRGELSEGPPPSSSEHERSVRMRRAIALWNTGWIVWEPVAVGLAFALPLVPSASALPVFVFAAGVSSVVGLFACGKALRVLSWLTNMPVVSAPPPKQPS